TSPKGARGQAYPRGRFRLSGCLPSLHLQVKVARHPATSVPSLNGPSVRAPQVVGDHLLHLQRVDLPILAVDDFAARRDHDRMWQRPRPLRVEYIPELISVLARVEVVLARHVQLLKDLQRLLGFLGIVQAEGISSKFRRRYMRVMVTTPAVR